jgi:glutaryl-CoA dehydrogenase (non-decarboxylating)
VIDFTLTKENRLVQQSARAFADAEILPNIRDWDARGEVHREVFARMGELGFLGAPIPERYGGAGMDYVSFAILCEELERADTAFRVVQSVHVGLNSLALLQWGSEDQRQRYLVPQARGEKLATFGLTEPGVGTDAGALQTTARRRGDRYILNGQKIWISLADIADHFLVFATLDRSKGHRAITAFIVERGFPGVSTATLHGKLGIRAGNTGVINLDGCEVPLENRVGEEGEGFLVAMSAIDQGRYTVAAGAVGLAQACLDASVAYARQRQTFGQEIGHHQLVKQMLANMVRGIETGRLLVWRAGWLKNHGRRNTRETSLAKWHATEHAVQAALDAIQVHGANGYSNEFPVERYLRNA